MQKNKKTLIAILISLVLVVLIIEFDLYFLNRNKNHESVNNFNSQTPNQTMEAYSSEAGDKQASGKTYNGFSLSGENIISSDGKNIIGNYKGGIITIYPIGGLKSKISFPGDINKLNIDDEFEIIQYDRIYFSSTVHGRYFSSADYKLSIDGNFSCEEEMFPTNDLQYYCNTDSKSEISEYIFTALGGYFSPAPGGPVACYQWKKIYGRKLSLGIVFVTLELNSEMACSDEGDDFEGNKLNFGTANYLDNLLQDKENKKIILEADNIVNNLK